MSDLEDQVYGAFVRRGWIIPTSESEVAMVEEETCNGLGYYECFCGGDFCVCDNYGEIPCYGCSECEPDDYDEDYGD